LATAKSLLDEGGGLTPRATATEMGRPRFANDQTQPAVAQSLESNSSGQLGPLQNQLLGLPADSPTLTCEMLWVETQFQTNQGRSMVSKRLDTATQLDRAVDINETQDGLFDGCWAQRQASGYKARFATIEC